MSAEWGPWIKHDGKGCPCVGQYVHLVFKDNAGEFIGIAGSQFDGTEEVEGSGWHWAVIDTWRWHKVDRYRIRKPRAMLIFEKILARIPDLVDAN